MVPARLRLPLIGMAIAVASTAIALLLYQLPLLRTMEWKIYDLEFRKLTNPANASRDIVMIEIDEESLEMMADNGFGRYPYPRDTYAALLSYLELGRPRVIAFDIPFIEPDTGTDGPARDRELVEATRRLGNVIHAFMVNDIYKFQPKSPLPGGYRLGPEVEEHLMVKFPYPGLAQASRMLGNTFFVFDSDGPVRRIVPFVRQGDNYYPSLGIATAMVALNLSPSDVSLEADGLHLGSITVPLMDVEVEYVEPVHARHMLVNYKGGPFLSGDRRARRTYRSYKIWDLLLSEGHIEEGKKPPVDPSEFKDKIVFIATSAPGLSDVFQTPFGDEGRMPGMQVHATVVDDILSRSFLRPAPRSWSVILLLISTLLVGILGVYVGFWWALGAAIAIGFADAGVAAFSFVHGFWLPCVPTVTGLLLAQFVSVAYKYFVEDRAKRQVKSLFSRYVSPAVVKELIEDPSRARLGGQRREMSVLFSDIRGFTTFSEAREPEEVIHQLNEYFTRMVELLFQHHGTLDKFVGDMIMGLFNAPILDPDHADHAVQMGLAMLEELKVLNARWAQEGRPSLDIGVGINTGDMIVGNVGSERTLSYTVLGDNVNLGSRLESLNKQYKTHIIISESTRSRLRGKYFTRPLGMVRVKGKTIDVEIFEVCRSQEELDQRNAAAVTPAPVIG